MTSLWRGWSGRVRRRVGPFVEDALVPNCSTFRRNNSVGIHFRDLGERHTQDPREEVSGAIVAQDDASPTSIFPQLRHRLREVLPCVQRRGAQRSRALRSPS